MAAVEPDRTIEAPGLSSGSVFCTVNTVPPTLRLNVSTRCSGVSSSSVAKTTPLAVPGHCLDLINLKIDRSRPVDHHVEFRHPIDECNAVGAPRKQVDCGRAKKLEIRGIHPVFQSHVLVVEDDDQVHLITVKLADRILKTDYFKK